MYSFVLYHDYYIYEYIILNYLLNLNRLLIKIIYIFNI